MSRCFQRRNSIRATFSSQPDSQTHDTRRSSFFVKCITTTMLHQPKTISVPPQPPDADPIDEDDNKSKSFQDDGIGGGLLLHNPDGEEPSSATLVAKNIASSTASTTTTTTDQQPQHVSKTSSSSANVSNELKQCQDQSPKSRAQDESFSTTENFTRVFSDTNLADQPTGTTCTTTPDDHDAAAVADEADALFSDTLFDSLDDVVRAGTGSDDTGPDLLAEPLLAANPNPVEHSTQHRHHHVVTPSCEEFDATPTNDNFEQLFGEDKKPFPWSPITSIQANDGGAATASTDDDGGPADRAPSPPPPSPVRYVHPVEKEFQNDGGDSRIIDLHQGIRMIVPVCSSSSASSSLTASSGHFGGEIENIGTVPLSLDMPNLNNGPLTDEEAEDFCRAMSPLSMDGAICEGAGTTDFVANQDNPTTSYDEQLPLAPDMFVQDHLDAKIINKDQDKHVHQVWESKTLLHNVPNSIIADPVMNRTTKAAFEKAALQEAAVIVDKALSHVDERKDIAEAASCAAAAAEIQRAATARVTNAADAAAREAADMAAKKERARNAAGYVLPTDAVGGDRIVAAAAETRESTNPSLESKTTKQKSTVVDSIKITPNQGSNSVLVSLVSVSVVSSESGINFKHLNAIIPTDVKEKIGEKKADEKKQAATSSDGVKSHATVVVSSQSNTPMSQEDKDWEANFAQLQSFHKIHGHFKVLEKDNAPLNKWAKKQRDTNRGSYKKIPSNWDVKKQRLDNLGFNWQYDAWDRRFNEVIAYHEQHGTYAVPEDAGELYLWLLEQRDLCIRRSCGLKYSKTVLTDVRFEQLKSKGIFEAPKPNKERNTNDKLWNASFDQLCKFKEDHGHCDGYNMSEPIGRWVHRQRSEASKWIAGKVTSFTYEKKKKLDEIGFDWKGYDIIPDQEAVAGRNNKNMTAVVASKVKVPPKAKPSAVLKPSRPPHAESSYVATRTSPRRMNQARQEDQVKQSVASSRLQTESLLRRENLFPVENQANLAAKPKPSLPATTSSASPEKRRMLSLPIISKSVMNSNHYSVSIGGPVRTFSKVEPITATVSLLHPTSSETVVSTKTGAPPSVISMPSSSFVDIAPSSLSIPTKQEEEAEKTEIDSKNLHLEDRKGAKRKFAYTDEVCEVFLEERASWDELFEDLVEFRNENGHCDVPPDFEQLCRWIQAQRAARKKRRKSALQEEQEAKLDSIGFDWVPPAPLPSPTVEDTESIASIATFDDSTVEDTESMESISTSVVDDGDDDDDDDDVEGIKERTYHDRRWNAMFETLCKFKEEHGHCDGLESQDSIRRWGKTQRYAIRLWLAGERTTFTAEKKKKLDGLGFDWRGYDIRPEAVKPASSKRAAATKAPARSKRTALKSTVKPYMAKKPLKAKVSKRAGATKVVAKARKNNQKLANAETIASRVTVEVPKRTGAKKDTASDARSQKPKNAWMKMFDELRDYQENCRCGESGIPPEGTKLHEWFLRQTHEYATKKKAKSSALTEAQARMLEEEAGFSYSKVQRTSPYTTKRKHAAGAKTSSRKNKKIKKS